MARDGAANDVRVGAVLGAGDLRLGKQSHAGLLSHRFCPRSNRRLSGGRICDTQCRRLPLTPGIAAQRLGVREESGHQQRRHESGGLWGLSWSLGRPLAVG